MNLELRLAAPRRLGPVERALRLATGKEFVCTWVCDPGEVLDACLGFRAHGERRPVVVVGLFAHGGAVRAAGEVVLQRHPFHYLYVEATRIREALPALARMEEMRDELACRRHLRRYALAGGLRRIALHDLRGGLAARDAERVVEVVRWLATREAPPAAVASLAERIAPHNALRIGEAILRLLDNQADG